MVFVKDLNSFEHNEIYLDSVKSQLSHFRNFFSFSGSTWSQWIDRGEILRPRIGPGCKSPSSSRVGDWVLPARAGNQAIFTYVIKEIFQTILSERERNLIAGEKFELLEKCIGRKHLCEPLKREVSSHTFIWRLYFLVLFRGICASKK